jgi:hypothetical protein
MTGRTRPPGGAILRLYPRSWRRRYEAEMMALLEEADLGIRARLDLARGAIDAWFHVTIRLAGPAALLCGGLWTIAGLFVIGQATPPDWPGYHIDVLPLTVAATTLGLIGILGCWSRQRDAVGRMGELAVLLATVGQAGWAAALIATIFGPTPGLAIVVGQAAGLIGCLLVGLAIVRTDDLVVGAVIAVASATMLFGWPIAWLGYGLAWTLAGSVLLWARDPIEPSWPRIA